MIERDAVEVLSALGQSTRLEVFRLLVRHAPEGLPSTEIARHLTIPASTMSAHLTILERAGLVTGQRHSRLIVYRADLTRLRTLMTFLVKDCCQGHADLCAPLLADLMPCCLEENQTTSVRVGAA